MAAMNGSASIDGNSSKVVVAKKSPNKYPGLKFIIFVKSKVSTGKKPETWFECALCAPAKKLAPKEMTVHFRDIIHLRKVMEAECPENYNQISNEGKKSSQEMQKVILDFESKCPPQTMVAANPENVSEKREGLVCLINLTKEQLKKEEELPCKAEEKYQEEDAKVFQKFNDVKDAEMKTNDDKNISQDDQELKVEKLCDEDKAGSGEDEEDLESKEVVKESEDGKNLMVDIEEEEPPLNLYMNPIPPKDLPVVDIQDYQFLQEGFQGKYLFMSIFEHLKKTLNDILRYHKGYPYYSLVEKSYLVKLLENQKGNITKTISAEEVDFVSNNANALYLDSNVLSYQHKPILPISKIRHVAKFFHESLRHPNCHTLFEILAREFFLFPDKTLSICESIQETCRICAGSNENFMNVHSLKVLEAYNTWPNRREMIALGFTELTNMSYCRNPNKIVIIGDERDCGLKSLTVKNVQVRICPGLNLENAYDFISCDPMFGQGVLFVVLCGTFTFVRWEIDMDCQKKGCPEPLLLPTVVKTRENDLFNVGMTAARNLHQSVMLNSTKDDVVFGHILPIALNSNAKFLAQKHYLLCKHKSTHPYILTPSKDSYVSLNVAMLNYNGWTDKFASELGYCPWNMSAGFFSEVIQNKKKIHKFNLGKLAEDGVHFTSITQVLRKDMITEICKSTIEKMAQKERNGLLKNFVSTINPLVSRIKNSRKFDKILIFCEPESKVLLDPFASSQVLITDAEISPNSIGQLCRDFNLKEFNTMWIFTSTIRPIAQKLLYEACSPKMNCPMQLPFLAPRNEFVSSPHAGTMGVSNLMKNVADVIKMTRDIVGDKCVAIVAPVLPVTLVNANLIKHDTIHRLYCTLPQVFVSNNSAIKELLPIYDNLRECSTAQAKLLLNEQGIHPFPFTLFKPRIKGSFRTLGAKQVHFPFIPLEWEEMMRNLIYMSLNGIPLSGQNIVSNSGLSKHSKPSNNAKFTRIAFLCNNTFDELITNFNCPLMQTITIDLNCSNEELEKVIEQVESFPAKTLFIFLADYSLILSESKRCDICKVHDCLTSPTSFILKNASESLFKGMDTGTFVDHCVKHAHQKISKLVCAVGGSSAFIVAPLCPMRVFLIGKDSPNENMHQEIHTMNPVKRVFEFFDGNYEDWTMATSTLDMLWSFLMESFSPSIGAPYKAVLDYEVKKEISLCIAHKSEEHETKFNQLQDWENMIAIFTDVCLSMRKDGKFADKKQSITESSSSLEPPPLPPQSLSLSNKTDDKNQKVLPPPFPFGGPTSPFMGPPMNMQGSNMGAFGASNIGQSPNMGPPPLNMGPPPPNMGPPPLNMGPPPPNMGPPPPNMGPPPPNMGPPTPNIGMPPPSLGPPPPNMGPQNSNLGFQPNMPPFMGQQNSFMQMAPQNQQLPYQGGVNYSSAPMESGQNLSSSVASSNANIAFPGRQTYSYPVPFLKAPEPSNTVISKPPVKYGDTTTPEVETKEEEGNKDFRVMVGKIANTIKDLELNMILSLIGNFIIFERPKVKNASYGVARFMTEDGADRCVRLLNDYPLRPGPIEVRYLYYRDGKDDLNKKLGISVLQKDQSIKALIVEQVKKMNLDIPKETKNIAIQEGNPEKEKAAITAMENKERLPNEQISANKSDPNENKKEPEANTPDVIEILSEEKKSTSMMAQSQAAKLASYLKRKKVSPSRSRSRSRDKIYRRKKSRSRSRTPSRSQSYSKYKSRSRYRSRSYSRSYSRSRSRSRSKSRSRSRTPDYYKNRGRGNYRRIQRGHGMRQKFPYHNRDMDNMRRDVDDNRWDMNRGRQTVDRSRRDFENRKEFDNSSRDVDSGRKDADRSNSRKEMDTAKRVMDIGRRCLEGDGKGEPAEIRRSVDERISIPGKPKSPPRERVRHSEPLKGLHLISSDEEELNVMASPPKMFEVRISNTPRLGSTKFLNDMVIACGSPTPCRKDGNLYYAQFPTLKRATMVSQHLNNWRIIDKVLKAEVLADTAGVESQISVVEDTAMAKEIESVFEEYRDTFVVKIQSEIMKEPDIFTFKIFKCGVTKCREYDCHYYHSPYDRRRDYLEFKYSERMCGHAKQGEPCPKGEYCNLCHSSIERIFHPKNYKTNVCLDWYDLKRCPKKSFCAKAHPLSSDSFFTEAWKDLFVAGLDQSFYFFAGAVKMLYKVPDNEGGVPIMFVTTLSEISKFAYEVAKPVARIHRLKISIITEVFQDPAGAHILIGTPSGLASLIESKGSAPLGGLRVLILDEVTTLMNNPYHQHHVKFIIQSIYSEVSNEKSICKVVTSETCHPTEIAKVEELLKTSFTLHNPHNVDPNITPVVVTAPPPPSPPGNSKGKKKLQEDNKSEVSDWEGGQEADKSSAISSSRVSRARSKGNVRKHSSSGSSSSSRSSSSRSSSRSRSRGRKRKHTNSPDAEGKENFSIFTSEMLAKMKCEENSAYREHDAAYEVYLDVPEMHPSYEDKYERFLQSYKKKYNTTEESEHMTKMWHKYWKLCIESIKGKDWKRKKRELLEKYRLQARAAKSEKTLSQYQHSSNEGQGSLIASSGMIPPMSSAEVVMAITEISSRPLKDFSVSGTLDLMEVLSDKIGDVGSSLKMIVNGVRFFGLKTKKGMDLIAQEDNILTMNIVFERLLNLGRTVAPEERNFFEKVIAWGIHLIKHAKNFKEPETLDTTKSSNQSTNKASKQSVRFDLNLFAQQTYNQDPNWIYKTLEESLEYVYGAKPDADIVKQMYANIGAIHLNMSASTPFLMGGSTVSGIFNNPGIVSHGDQTPSVSSFANIPLTPMTPQQSFSASYQTPVMSYSSSTQNKPLTDTTTPLNISQPTSSPHLSSQLDKNSNSPHSEYSSQSFSNPPPPDAVPLPHLDSSSFSNPPPPPPESVPPPPPPPPEESANFLNQFMSYSSSQSQPSPADSASSAPLDTQSSTMIDAILTMAKQGTYRK